jgi:CysZ protein
MIRDAIDGVVSYGQAISYLSRERVWLYAFIPAAISLILAIILFLSVRAYADDFGLWLLSWWSWDFGRPFIEGASKWIGGIIMGVLSFTLFKYVVLILAAPFMSPLSEKIEKMATGVSSDVGFSAAVMLQDLVRGLRINLRNLLRELIFTLGLLILGLIPVFSIISGILIFLIQAYYAGFGNMDYTLERYYRVRSSVRFVRGHKGLAIGNGAVFMLLLGIPVIGVIVALPLSTIAATLETTRRIPNTA